jgi:serine/threonine protein kinase
MVAAAQGRPLFHHSKYCLNFFLSISFLHPFSLGSLPTPPPTQICVHAATGIEFLHNVVHVVHRDIKSMNLLVSDEWVTKVR